MYNADGEHVSGTSNVLYADATVHFLSDEHLPFAIAAIFTLIFIFLPPLLLIFYPCKISNRVLNCCHKRKWHALKVFVAAFHGCYKTGVTGGWDFRSVSGVYLLFRFVLVVVQYRIGYQIVCMVAACNDVPGFIHSHISCTALQEKLHECVGWFIACSNWVPHTINCHISVHPAFS